MTQTAAYEGPLAGLTVLDFGHYYAGPLVGLLLADQGANVIRIVRPGQRELPEQQYRLFNRNKKVLELDLKTAEGKERALKLIKKADVLIENFRPGVMKRLGLDYSSVKGFNPALVYISLPGFSSSDTKRAHIQAWEGVLGAALGAFSAYNGLRQPLGYPPLYTSLPHCSVYGGIHGATAAVAALTAREDHGFGTVIEVPLVEAGTSALTDGFVNKLDKTRPQSGEEEAPKDMPDTEDPMVPYHYQAGDSAVTQTEKLVEAGQKFTHPGCKNYLTKDGKLLTNWGLAWAPHVTAFMKALGIDKKLAREGFVNLGPWETGLDNNLSNPWVPLSPERYERLEQLMKETIASKTAAEWENLILKNIVGLTRSRSEWMTVAPLQVSGMFTKLDNGVSELTVPGRLCDVSSSNGELMEQGHDLEAVSFDQAVSILNSEKAEQLAAKRSAVKGERPEQRKGDLLKGLKVLDLANVMAAPMSCYVMGQYGAEVITGCAIGNFPAHQQNVLEANMGKRSILNDTSTAPGREILARLVKQADVVLHNILDHTAFRMGVTHDQLKGIKPDIISCQVSAFGGSYRGGWEKRPGVDMSVQAETGLTEFFGAPGYPQMVGLAAACDCITGQSAAFAMMLAVYQKRATGVAGEARTSLARSNNYFQLPWMIMENGNCDWGEERGQATFGPNQNQRIYQTADGWIYVHAREDQADLLLEVVCSGGGATDADLEEAFKGLPTAHWEEVLDAAGIARHMVIGLDDYYDQLTPVENDAEHAKAEGPLEMLLWENHPCGTPVALPSPTWVRVGEDHSYYRCKVSPRRGQHTREVLLELGYDEGQVNQLIENRVAWEYQPEIGNMNDFFYNPR